MNGGAHISDCGRYRYAIWRHWGGGKGPVLWVLCNPSTADAEKDDPTIRKCIGFTKRWGFDAITVVNVFAWRATNPSELGPLGGDRDGPENDSIIQHHAKSHALVVAAWGTIAYGINPPRVRYVRGLLGRDAVCLKKSKAGHPWHPLYVPYAKTLEPL